ncbi:MAG: hypothetical protein MK100_01035 [Phycisphaerales bacterium]|nr:hypothetical protein [Phycisphaerales bacterium]
MSSHTRELAPAKLNMALSVGVIDDACGLHPISSWMLTVDFYDELQVTRLAEDSISRYAIEWHADAIRTTEIDWRITDDLAVRAHLAIERYVGRQLPVQLRTLKRIPTGSGLGGGSSDAAAMLRACNRLFELELDDASLQLIARSIGSDVPFLVRGGSALVSGFGERIEPIEAAGSPAVLILPESACPTGSIYRRFDELGGAQLRAEEVAIAVQGGALFNDLTESAFQEAGELRSLASSIHASTGREIHLSGSGSTMFITCDTPAEAGEIALEITDAHNVPTVPVRPIMIEYDTIETNN